MFGGVAPPICSATIFLIISSIEALGDVLESPPAPYFGAEKEGVLEPEAFPCALLSGLLFGQLLAPEWKVCPLIPLIGLLGVLYSSSGMLNSGGGVGALRAAEPSSHSLEEGL